MVVGLVTRTATFLEATTTPAGAASSRGGLLGARMPSGTLKWFDALGYGLIQPDDGGNDVLVHVSAVRKAALASAGDGTRLSYDMVNRLGKQAAENLRLLDHSLERRSPTSLPVIKLIM